jgi:hypothetical protein
MTHELLQIFAALGESLAPDHWYPAPHPYIFQTQSVKNVIESGDQDRSTAL